MEEFGDIFTDHASKLVEVANLACSMSNNEDGVKMVRYAAAQIETLCPQVYNKYIVVSSYTYTFIYSTYCIILLFHQRL